MELFSSAKVVVAFFSTGAAGAFGAASVFSALVSFEESDFSTFSSLTESFGFSTFSSFGAVSVFSAFFSFGASSFFSTLSSLEEASFFSYLSSFESSTGFSIFLSLDESDFSFFSSLAPSFLEFSVTLFSLVKFNFSSFFSVFFSTFFSSVFTSLFGYFEFYYPSTAALYASGSGHATECLGPGSTSVSLTSLS